MHTMAQISQKKICVTKDPKLANCKTNTSNFFSVSHQTMILYQYNKYTPNGIIIEGILVFSRRKKKISVFT